MHIAVINRPGTWLKLADEELAREIDRMLSSMEDLVAEVAIALTMFEVASLSRSRNFRKGVEIDRQIYREVDGLFQQEAGDLYREDYDLYCLERDRRVLKRKAELGIAPRNYAHKVPLMYAHAFIYAVDSFGKFLDELSKYPDLPETVTELKDSFNAELPTIRKIRNSALHIEDRSRGYGTRKGVRMQTNGFLGLSNLEGNQLCYTIDDGTYQRVAISADTLATIARIMNELLGSFEWSGPPKIFPH